MTTTAKDGLSKEQLLAAGRAAGYSPTGALLDDYVKRGLLDIAQRQSLGRRGGVTGRWGSNQAALFAELLRRRTEDHTPLRRLLNIPVAMWFCSATSTCRPVKLTGRWSSSSGLP